MANYQERIIFGMSNIHYALKKEDGQYEAPVALLGAKSIECSYSAETTEISADDKVVYSLSTLASGEGR